MGTSFRNAEDRNWRRNLKDFSESSAWEEGGPTCSHAGDRPARDTPLSLLSVVDIFPFHSCCVVLSLCFLPLLLSRLFRTCPNCQVLCLFDCDISSSLRKYRAVSSDPYLREAILC